MRCANFGSHSFFRVTSRVALAIKSSRRGWGCQKREDPELTFNVTRLVAWRRRNAFHPINEVTLRRAGLVLGWVTAAGR